jgi:glycerol-3-phosphate dehydrogenase (NAD(P)+)
MRIAVPGAGSWGTTVASLLAGRHDPRPYLRPWNRTLGERLGAGQTLEEITATTRAVAEGVGTAFTVHELSQRYGVEMPVCHEVCRVLTGEIPVPEAYRGLRIRDGHEREPG